MKKIILKTSIALLLIGLLSCGKNGAEDSTTETKEPASRVSLSDAQVKTAAISTTTLSSVEMSGILKVSGRIEAPPQNRVSVSAALGGYLRSTALLPGMKVKKGEVIAVMEDQQFINIQQQYLTALARMNYAEQELKRQQELNASKSSSDKVLQQAQADYESVRIELFSLAEKLRLIGIDPSRLTASGLSRTVNIYSPVNGYVTKVNVNTGKYVNPSDELFELVNPDDIHLALTVFEKDIDKLEIGQQVIAYSNNSRTKYNAEIILVGRNLSAERSIEVHCHFKTYDAALIPGMFMNADIRTKPASVFAVPAESVVNFEGKDYLFVESGHNIFEMVPAETGLAADSMIEIRNAPDIREKKVVAKGAYSLLMSLKNAGE